jgi:hypothetical protein
VCQACQQCRKAQQINERGQRNLTFNLSFPRAVQSAHRMGASLPTRQRPTDRRPVHRYSHTSSSVRTRTGGVSRASAVCPARQWRTRSSVMYRCCRAVRKITRLEERCLGARRLAETLHGGLEASSRRAARLIVRLAWPLDTWALRPATRLTKKR